MSQLGGWVEKYRECGIREEADGDRIVSWLGGWKIIESLAVKRAP